MQGLRAGRRRNRPAVSWPLLASATPLPNAIALPEGALAAIRTPALLYAGTLDEPEPTKRSRRLVANATFVVLEGINHAQALSRSGLILPQLLQFLGRVEATLPTSR